MRQVRRLNKIFADAPKRLGRALWLVFLLPSLAGCGGDNLHAYIAEIKKRPPRPLKPVPGILRYAPVVYNADALRDPFTKSLNIGNALLGPDKNRPKEYLESFPLDSLHMVGTVNGAEGTWALIATQEGKVYRVTIGNYLGQNYGKIVQILPDKIALVETVVDQDEWVKRPVFLALAEASPAN